MRDISKFNEDQRKAILHTTGPCAVVASAGSGKTACVIERIINLIGEDTDPSRIFACTFTKKAAGEMRQRLVKEIGSEGEMVQISTLHSFGYQVLKKYYQRYKPREKFQLVNTGLLWMYMTKVMKEEETKIKDVKSFLGQVSRLKLGTIGVQEFYDNLPDEKKDPSYPFDHKKDEDLAFYLLYKKYDQYLKKNGQIDFSDMLYRVYLIFKDPENEKFVQGIRNRIDYLMVDEFQDTNPISYFIYKTIIGNTGNFFVVGDPRQAIYSFQGADSSIIREFIDDNNAQVIELPRNYRSTSTIVDHANNLISFADDLGNLKPTVANRNEGSQITTFTFPDEVTEAQMITDKILEKIEQGFRYQDIAILYRVHSQSLPILDQFTVTKIPYRLYGSYSLMDKKEIKVIVSYIKLITRPKQVTKEEAWEVANNPLRYIRKSTFEELEDDAYENDDCFYHSLIQFDDVIKDYKQARCIRNLVDDINKGRQWFRSTPNATTVGLIDFILNKLKLKEWFETPDGMNSSTDGNGEEEDKELNLGILYSMAEKYTMTEDFLNFTDSLKGQSKKDSEDENRDAVHLLSLHRSKGLEFPVVFIIGVCSRLMPFHRAMEEGNIEEERRLAYVGVTRAEDKLYLSSINGKLGRFNVTPSVFIEELGL